MLERVHIKYFKCLRDVELGFGRLTVLVGPNGSGKTSVLRAMDYLGAAAQKQAGECLRRMNKMDEFPEASRRENRARESLGEKAGSGPVVLEGTINLTDKMVLARVADQWKTTLLSGDPVPCEMTDAEQLLGLFRLLERWLFLHLEPERIAAPSYLEGASPNMKSDGYGLPVVLADLAVNQPERHQGVLSALKLVVPNVERVRARRAEVEVPLVPIVRFLHNITEQLFDERPSKVWGHALELDVRGASRVEARDISQGTLIVLGLLTAIMLPEQPGLLLLDDIDRALHPIAQVRLMEQIRKLLDLFPDLQIIATTHSPYILDQCKQEEVRLSTLDEEGVAHIASLTEHPDFNRWKDEMLPGELWTVVGESWVKDAAARRAEQPKNG